MAEPLRHRQTKEAATDMFSLQPPRHIPTLPVQFFALAFSPEQEFLVRERLFWSIHVALRFSWPCYLRSGKERTYNNKKPKALAGLYLCRFHRDRPNLLERQV